VVSRPAIICSRTSENGSYSAANLDLYARRILARTLFLAVHGIVALASREKPRVLAIADLRIQLAATVRAIASGQGPLRTRSRRRVAPSQ